jgi:hypothetical protein
LGFLVHRLLQRLPSPQPVDLFGQLRRLQSPPELAHGRMHLLHQWTGHPHGEVKTRCIQRAMVGVNPIVEHIDAATKCHLTIHHAQLAMQTPPAAGHQQPQTPQWRKHAPLRTRRSQPCRPSLRQRGRTHTIHHHTHVDTTSSRTLQRLKHLLTTRIKSKDISLQPNLMQAAVHGLNQR